MVHKPAVLFSVTDITIMSMWILNNTNEGRKKATPKNGGVGKKNINKKWEEKQRGKSNNYTSAFVWKARQNIN